MHPPYFRLPRGFAKEPELPVPRKRRPKRARWRRSAFSLTVLAELFSCDTTAPYRGAKKFGLRVWVRSKLREQLTRGSNYAFSLQIERVIRFNAAELERHARFVLAVRDEHQGKPLDGEKLAEALEMPSWQSRPGFLNVWLAHLTSLAEELVEVSRIGHLEDLPWSKAERYLDTVVPRLRTLRRIDPDAESPLPNRFGGLRRMNRIVDGLTSKDPKVVKATLQGWDLMRLNCPDAPDPTGWEDW